MDKFFVKQVFRSFADSAVIVVVCVLHHSFKVCHIVLGKNKLYKLILLFHRSTLAPPFSPNTSDYARIQQTVASQLVMLAPLVPAVVSTSRCRVRSLLIKSSPGYPLGLIGIANAYLFKKASHSSSDGYCLPNICLSAVYPTIYAPLDLSATGKLYASHLLDPLETKASVCLIQNESWNFFISILSPTCYAS